jgi:hypothetical protein
VLFLGFPHSTALENHGHEHFRLRCVFADARAAGFGDMGFFDASVTETEKAYG